MRFQRNHSHQVFSNNATWMLGIKMLPFSYSYQHFGKTLCASINDTIIYPAILLGLLQEIHTLKPKSKHGRVVLPPPRSWQLAQPKTSASLIGVCLKLPLSFTSLLPSGHFP